MRWALLREWTVQPKQPIWPILSYREFGHCFATADTLPKKVVFAVAVAQFTKFTLLFQLFQLPQDEQQQQQQQQQQGCLLSLWRRNQMYGNCKVQANPSSAQQFIFSLKAS